jgi:hypothetical protein
MAFRAAHEEPRILVTTQIAHEESTRMRLGMVLAKLLVAQVALIAMLIPALRAACLTRGQAWHSAYLP